MNWLPAEGSQRRQDMGNIGNVFYMDWEVSLIARMQEVLGSFGMTVSKLFSFIGGEEVSLLVLLVVLFCWSREAGKRSALTLLAATAWFPMVKNVVLRSRPYMAHPDDVRIEQIPEPDADPMDIVQQGYSLPSGHSAMSLAIFGSIARESRKKWTWTLAILLPLLIGISRVAVGAHYPTDVLAGWAIGLAAMGFTALLEKKVKNETVRYLILLATVLPGVFWCNSRDYFSALGAMIGAVIALPYEEKYVHFKDTRKVPVMILRVIGAGAIYFLLNTLLKLPFSKEFLNNGTLGANLVRTLRYSILLFVIIGVYPRCFPALEKLFEKKTEARGERNMRR